MTTSNFQSGSDGMRGLLLKRFIKRGLGLATALLCAAGASAQDPSTSSGQAFPVRPLRLIVPFAAGGGTDLVARALAQRLAQELGQPVVVENRAGASGVIGTDATAKAVPDGYTLMIATPTFTVNPSLMAKLPYNTARDFAPVTLVATSPHLLAVHPGLPVRNLAELVAHAKQASTPPSYSSGSVGGSSHLAGELFSTMAGVQMIHVPYKGTGEAAAAVVAGTVSMAFLDVQTLLPLVKAGRLRAIAVTGARRSSVIPELPTIAESGYPGFESGLWYGIVVPARTPVPLLAKLNAGIVNVVHKPEMQKVLRDVAADPVGSTPQAFGELIATELERWAKVVKRAGIEPTN